MDTFTIVRIVIEVFLIILVKCSNNNASFLAITTKRKHLKRQETKTTLLTECLSIGERGCIKCCFTILKPLFVVNMNIATLDVPGFTQVQLLKIDQIQ